MKKLFISVLLICVAFSVALSGCIEQSTESVSTVQKKDQEITAKTFTKLSKAVPAPELNDSVERKNLVARLKRFNVASKISYIYLISYGKVMAYYPIKGKVSSVNSMLTCTDQIVANNFTGSAYSFNVVSSPDLDGSYGSNGDGIFFFTTEDVYVEWNGEYMLCDEPLKLSTPPALVYSKSVD
jgi:hypothetical protein